MTRRGTAWFMSIAVMLATTSGAQNIPGNPSRPGNPVKTEEIKVSEEVKLVGCLSKNTAGVFQMKSPMIETHPWFTPAGAKTVGTPTPVKSGTTFELRNGTGLDAHLGHKVEVLGTLEPGSANTAPTPDTIGGPGGTGGITPNSVPRLDFPKLDIKTLKMVSATCP